MSESFDPYGAAQPDKPAKSGASTLLIGLGIGCGVVLLLCCGFFGVAGYMGSQYIKNAMVSDPVKIREITGEIATIEVPESIPPKMGLDLKVPFSDKQLGKMAIYVDEANKNMLTIGQFNVPDQERDSARIQFDQSMQSNQARREDVRVIESETRTTQVNGEEAKFTISKAEGKRTKEELWQVEGEFKGKAGMGILVILVNASDFTKEDVNKIVDSIK